MIRLSERAIMLLESGGETVPFEPLELQTVLSGCFAASGLTEQRFLAEDITLAVELAMSETRRGSRPFIRSELNSTVLQILRNTGFPEVAERYAEICDCLRIDCANQTGAIAAILRRFMACGEESCAALAAKVADALTALRIANAPHTLILELARFYDDGFVVKAPEVPADAGPVMLATAAELNSDAGLPSGVRELLERGIIRYRGISRVFPSVRIGVNLCRLADSGKAALPLTEMEALPLFDALAPVLDAACDAARRRVAHCGHPDAPVCLTLLDARCFALEYLGAEWPRGRKLGRDFLRLAADRMTTAISGISSAE